MSKEKNFLPYFIVNQYNIDSINVPQGVTKIPDYSFYKCTSLTNIDFPTSIEYIGVGAFMLTNLKEAIIRANSSIGNLVIEKAAFAGCSNIKRVYLGEGIKSIGESTFLECKNLESVYISSTIELIEKSAFKNCTKLKTVIFDKNSLNDIKKMENYPWDIRNPEIIILRKDFEKKSNQNVKDIMENEIGNYSKNHIKETKDIEKWISTYLKSIM